MLPNPVRLGVGVSLRLVKMQGAPCALPLYWLMSPKARDQAPRTVHILGAHTVTKCTANAAVFVVVAVVAEFAA
jgi:hypothetical protein